MAFEDKVVALPAPKGPSFGVPPGSCKCGEKSVIALMTVVNTNTGHIITGAASDFCTHDDKTGRIDDLKGHLKFRSWEAHCADCWSGLSIKGQRKYTDKQVSVAWRWLIGETCRGSDSMGGVFKPISLSDSQRDTAIEIVNYEAKRLNMPESVPEEYRMPEVWG